MTARAVVGSAPGKLILTGEYAVLDGAPALVVAIDRRATAHISAPEQAGVFTVHAADLDLNATGSLTGARSREGITSSAVPGRPDLTGVRWDADARTVAGLSLITHVLEHLARRGPVPPCTMTLSTAAFFDGAGVKLGLGSSAALTVALAGALAAHAGQPAPTLAELIDLHRAFQGGRGSGADIAASYTGGIICYTASSTASSPVTAPPSSSPSPPAPSSSPVRSPAPAPSSAPPSPPAPSSAPSSSSAPSPFSSSETRRIAAKTPENDCYTTGSKGAAAGSAPATRTGSKGATAGGAPATRTGSGESTPGGAPATRTGSGESTPGSAPATRTRPATPTSTPATLPADLACAVVFTGRSASTAAMLTQLEAWRTQHPRQYQVAGARLSAAAEHAARLCRNASRAHPVINPTEFLAAIDAYADALDALGAAANLDIMSPDHRRLRNLAAEHDVIYKPSGAGGGDIGVAFAGDADHIARFRDSATAAGYRMIEVDVDRQGLAITDG